jgi:prephenate dehydratase
VASIEQTQEFASLESFAHHEVNLLKIERRPIRGRAWEYQFFLDVESERPGHLEVAPR